LALCQCAESHFFDRKAAAISGQKLQKIVVAFANADGGEVVVGIADDEDQPDPTKRWCGTTTIEAFNGLLQAVHGLNPSVDVRYEFLKHQMLDTLVLHMSVERSADVNRTADGKVYQRSGAQSLPLVADQITELGFAKGARSYENMKLPDLLLEQVQMRRS
jgi:ATP-dependent DNA helicase RecG